MELAFAVFKSRGSTIVLILGIGVYLCQDMVGVLDNK